MVIGLLLSVLASMAYGGPTCSSTGRPRTHRPSCRCRPGSSSTSPAGRGGWAGSPPSPPARACRPPLWTPVEAAGLLATVVGAYQLARSPLAVAEPRPSSGNLRGPAIQRPKPVIQ